MAYEIGSGEPLPHEIKKERRKRSENYDVVDRPEHYVGSGRTIEPIVVLEEWAGDDGLLFCCLKYLSRAGRKANTPKVQDLKKARWYLDRAIQREERRT